MRKKYTLRLTMHIWEANIKIDPKEMVQMGVE